MKFLLTIVFGFLVKCLRIISATFCNRHTLSVPPLSPSLPPSLPPERERERERERREREERERERERERAIRNRSKKLKNCPLKGNTDSMTLNQKHKHIPVQALNLKETGIWEVIAIFWTINDPPGLQAF